jgi:cell division protein ZipA
MDELRLILIILGLFLLVAIYWMGRRDERRALEKKTSPQVPHSPSTAVKASWFEDDESVDPADKPADYDSFYLSDADNEIFFKTEMEPSGVAQTRARPGHSTLGKVASANKSKSVLISTTEPATRTMELPDGVEPLLVNLTVMAPKDMSFDPDYLKQVLDDSGLVHGDMNIYHYYRKPKLEFEPDRGQRLFSIANIVEPGYFDLRDLETYRTPGIALFLQLPGPIDGVLAFEKMHQVAAMLSKQLSGTLCDDKRNKITPQAVTHIKDQISEYNLRLRTKLKRTVH